MLVLENSYMPSCLDGAECANVCAGEDTVAVATGRHFWKSSEAWTLQNYYVCRGESESSAYVGFQLPQHVPGHCKILLPGKYLQLANKDCLCRTRGKTYENITVMPGV